ncbi:hypothetical protein [Brevibacillus brevis]|uniref:hypothetical protein n=1 Tax=Brevibacillus brevis TaxID=1393 RepID=UPI00034B59AA|nr:hypothetical protein [Brevibacillus brevis]
MEDVSWEPLILPDPKKAVSHEQAVKEYLKVRPLELQYLTPDTDILSDNPSYQPILVYRTAISHQMSILSRITETINPFWCTEQPYP